MSFTVNVLLTCILNCDAGPVSVQISVLRVVWNIEIEFLLSVLKLVGTRRNTSSFQQLDKHGILL